MNKILVGFLSMTLVLMLSLVSTNFNVVEAASKHASSKTYKQKHKKVRSKRKHRRSKSKHRKSRYKKKRRSGRVGGCQTLSSSILQKKASPYNKSIAKASKKYGVSKSLIKAVITIESCFKSRARGALGEKGLMQLMPGTARRLKVKDGYNVSQNVHGGAKYLSFLLNRYHGNMQRAIAAYNAGEGNIDKGRIPNRRYVNKVLHAYSKFSSSQSVAFKPTVKRLNDSKKPSSKVAKEQGKSSGSYIVQQGETVYEVMRQTGMPVKKIIKLNGLKQPYGLKAGQALKVSSSKKANYQRKSPAKNLRAADAYIVQTSDTVYNVMRQTGVSVAKISQLNGLSAPYSISAGQELKLK